jgi:predicted DNA-binding transcriptional regulator AlpA
MQHPDELLALPDCLRRVGGTRPINAATWYRGIKAQRYPKGIKVGPNSVRWLASEVEAALAKLAEVRS